MLLLLSLGFGKHFPCFLSLSRVDDDHRPITHERCASFAVEARPMSRFGHFRRLRAAIGELKNPRNTARVRACPSPDFEPSTGVRRPRCEFVGAKGYHVQPQICRRWL